jgi:cytidylate kinase
MLNRVIQALAQHGNVVILGRGSCAVLGGFADVLNVRVQATLSARTERVMTRYNLTDIEQASRLVRKNDKI